MTSSGSVAGNEMNVEVGAAVAAADGGVCPDAAASPGR